ncbi:hypothetical protein [Xanthobacter tagetidis]|uniref:hypothetical protein n=1 Tax=Xanthobacter tagetidis TaxID=60216 RepID=UPI0011C4A845|nr:hypothetical protein [Xanthobacter tagetidis]MBB6309622.1 hypothetical protein [Xanthobacter tagetidis]
MQAGHTSPFRAPHSLAQADATLLFYLHIFLANRLGHAYPPHRGGTERGRERTPRVPPLRILIANNHLVNFAGSEIHALELAEHLNGCGHEAVLTALVVAAPFTGEAIRRRVPVVPMRKLDWGAFWDVVWSHHVPAFQFIHGKLQLKARRHLHGLLSSVLALERPPLPADFRMGRRSLTFLPNSELTLASASRHLPCDARTQILRNLAPDAWVEAVRGAHAAEPAAIACVSNHPPAEICELAELARAAGMRFDIIGAGQSGTARRVSPALLAPYDLVISIGKTVNYCLAAAIPIFVYDHFGGPGWLDAKRIGPAEATIFSGKCTPGARPASRLLAEIRAGYRRASAFAAQTASWSAARYGVGAQIERLGLLEGLDRRPQALLPWWWGRRRVRVFNRALVAETV